MGEVTGARVGDGRRIAVYLRRPQFNEHDRTTIEEQRAACLAVAGDLGYGVDDEAIIEEDAPNSSLARAGIARLIELIARGRVAAVIANSLDRLGRPESEGLEALLRELQRRGIPIYVARIPKGYRYDPATGKLLHDPALVAAANREAARPPEYIVIPRETEQHEALADFQLLRGASGDGHAGGGANGKAPGG